MMQKVELQRILGNNLLRLRMEKKMTREQLAEKVGLSTTFYANLESGNKMMSVASLRKIADALGTTTDSILYSDRPCDAADRISASLRNYSEETALFAEKLIHLCLEEYPQCHELIAVADGREDHTE